MGWIHDLGGKAGYGPIDVNEVEKPFHHDFEGRMWGISRMSRDPSWTIDWWRHVRENIPRDDYLSRPYFDSWAQTHMAAFIDVGAFDFADLDAALAKPSVVPRDQTLTKEDAIAQNRNLDYRFDRPTDAPVLFADNQKICTAKTMHGGHTRLPEYARGKQGRILTHRGAHLLPDDGARGIHNAQHLYTVLFDAHELWGEEAQSGDTVSLDLWESYLEPI